MARLGEAGRGEEWQGEASAVISRLQILRVCFRVAIAAKGVARQGVAWQGVVRHGKAWQGLQCSGPGIQRVSFPVQ